MFKKNLVITLSALLIAVVSGCKNKTETTNNKNTSSNSNSENTATEVNNRPAGDYGDALSTGEIAEPINLIPAMATDSASHNITSYIYNGLVKFDKDLNIVGDLAEKWEISEDKKEITFYLRKGVKWHDGVEFTAEDVKFTYEFMISDDTPTAYDSNYRLIDTVEIIDPHTIKVTYKNPIVTALTSWAWIMPKHALTGKPSQSTLQRKPIGTGPYKLESWTSGQSLVLTSFHDYFEGRPKIEKVFVKVIPNQTTQYLELLNGSIDTMTLTSKQANLDSKTPKYEDKYNTYSYLDFAYTYIGYNLNKAPFNIKEFRQALSYAVPKQEIIDGILFGKGVIATGPYKPDTFWYNKNVKEYPFDPAKAKELLKQAGFEDINNDGFLEYRGKPFQVELMTNQGADIRGKIVEIVQHNWNNIGIKTQIKQLEWASMLTEKRKGNFDAILLGWSITQDPDLYDIWSSERIEKGYNFIGYKNARVDEILKEGQHEFDKDRRKKLYDELQVILAEEQPYTFLYVPYTHIALNKRFHNVKPEKAGISYNFIDWYVPKNEQKYHVLDR